MHSYYFLLIFFLLLTKFSKTIKLPEGVTKCKTEDNKCLIKSTSDFIVNNKNGNSAIGFPSIEPFQIDSVVFTEGQDGHAPLTLTLLLQQIDVVGLSTIKIENIIGFSKDPKTSKFELYGYIPKFAVKGKYKVNGRIFVLPIQGHGNFEISIENLKLAMKFKPTVTVINGKQYLKIDKMKMKFEPENVQLQLTNLFNGDEALGSNMNRFLNENWRTVWQEMSPTIDNVVQETLKNLINTVFNRYSYEDILITDSD